MYLGPKLLIAVVGHGYSWWLPAHLIFPNRNSMCCLCWVLLFLGVRLWVDGHHDFGAGSTTYRLSLRRGLL
jgi:hypothetical protein